MSDQSRARWYDPNSGRFISEDPIGFADGPNPYRYAGNNPILYVDPTGLFSENAYPLNNLAGGFATGTLASRPSIIDSSFARPFNSLSNTASLSRDYLTNHLSSNGSLLPTAVPRRPSNVIENSLRRYNTDPSYREQVAYQAFLRAFLGWVT